ncbi:MtrAB system histidine kinase MtrB [Microbacterium sp. gxy059]|uniref:MtrAB system histidine kinase MtrB n=1 Tax=Microbacterium sp. gxy059 TaxID=2957199 RepID=UPI003D9643D2
MRLHTVLRRPHLLWRYAARLWRRSLRFRTILITTASATVAIIVAIVWAALAIQADLFDGRRDQLLAEANRAIATAQDSVDQAPAPTDRAAVWALQRELLDVLQTQASTAYIAGAPIEGRTTPDAPPAFSTLTDAFGQSDVSPGLRERVRDIPETQWWQSISLPAERGYDVPGIVIGQQLQVPNVGLFEIYFAYPLDDVARTLAYVQLTLWITGIALVVIIAGVLWLVMRAVAGPIIDVARTSATLAAGDLSARLDVAGEDELATLARSFNQMADSIESQIRELAELSLVQQRFVSDVSHELRTPLTTIRLAAGVLFSERASFDPVSARSAELLHDQVARFEELLADLLEISRYDAGSVQLERESVSVADIVGDVVSSMTQVAEQNGTELRFVTASDDVVADVDPRRVRRVLRNLVGNAIEHGEGQPIDVTVASDGRAVAVGVRDYGLGMRPEDAERVFDRFWRGDPSRQRTLGGTGLGLSIALGDATLHGGRLEVWSHLGVGTHFVLTLPREADVEASTSPIPVVPPGELPASEQLAGNPSDTETLVVAHERKGERP